MIDIKKKHPQAVWNKLEVFMVPEVLSNLNRLERVLISRRILFKKVIAPKGKFLKLKGSICNVPIDTADIVNVLPRGADSNGLVVVKLSYFTEVKHKLNVNVGYVTEVMLILNLYDTN